MCSTCLGESSLTPTAITSASSSDFHKSLWQQHLLQLILDGQTDRRGPVVSTSSSACSHSPTTAFCEVTKCQLHQRAPVPRAALLHQHGSHVFNSHLRHGAESVLPLPAPQSRPRTTGVACWVWFMCKRKSKSLESKKYK